MSDPAVSQTSGESTNPLSGNGQPTVVPDENQRELAKKQRTEVRMFWALANRLMRLWRGKFLEIDVNGMIYLAVCFPASSWQKNDNGAWFPKELLELANAPESEERKE